MFVILFIITFRKTYRNESDLNVMDSYMRCVIYLRIQLSEKVGVYSFVNLI